jgi:hypothetical protein
MSITGNDIVNDLRAEIIEPSPTFFSNTRLLYLINLAQREYVRLTRVLQSFAFTSSIQGQADYPMPTDWLGSEKVFYNMTTDGTTPNWRPLDATNLEKLGQEYPNFLSTDSSMQGTPKFYYVIGSTLYIFPRPDTAIQNGIFMFYESKAPALSSLDDALSIDDSLYPGVRSYVLAKLWKQDNEDAKSKEEMSGDERNPGHFEVEIGRGRKWRNKRILDGKWKIDIQSPMGYTYGGWGSDSTTNGLNPLNM